MAEKTIIAWTNHTWNMAWGCTKVSRGCEKCYADTLSHRYGWDVWGKGKKRRTFGDKHWLEPLKWNAAAAKAGERRRVFCSSMCDVFEDHPTIDAEREKLWPLIRSTPWLDWQLLTKRPERIADRLPFDWADGFHNVWLGTSIEDQEAADKRVPRLLSVPSTIHFFSYEPALGPIDLLPLIGYNSPHEVCSTIRPDSPCRCGGRGVIRGFAGPHLEAQKTGLGPMEQVGPAEQLPEVQSGKQTPKRLFTSEAHGERAAMAHDRASFGVSSSSRSNPATVDDQSQERQQGGQPANESGTGDLFPTNSPRSRRSESRDCRSMGRKEPHEQVDGSASAANTTASLRRGDTCEHCGRLRDSLSASLKDSPWAKVAAGIWTIFGGESGPGYRPCDLEWARSMKRQCEVSGMRFFFKQSAAPRTEMGIELDGAIVRDYPSRRLSLPIL